ncbi:hypothetical protein [Lysinibacter sp. HNR]|uniref:hypothetical protein n=1 Tax=Lysinibacter sp. HNR TaxID=3031408 RepID=UPI002435C67C|nr:hypothetical protein [Lysinibacter sp. HNR]WGD37472.1 hypothetical protein FrondiHNR_00685 [Lysinibacter sp. HNR]
MTSISSTINARAHAPLRADTLEINRAAPVTASPVIAIAVAYVGGALAAGLTVGMNYG